MAAAEAAAAARACGCCRYFVEKHTRCSSVITAIISIMLIKFLFFSFSVTLLLNDFHVYD